MTDQQRISEIRARCDEGRPIRRIDVKYLLDRLAEAVAWCAEHGLRFDYVNENAAELTALYGNDCRKNGTNALALEYGVSAPYVWRIVTGGKRLEVEHDD